MSARFSQLARMRLGHGAESFQRWLSEELRYSRMSLGLGPIAADLRSRASIGLLGLPIIAQLQQREGARAVRVRIRLKDRVFAVFLRGRMDLEVLHEIAINDEYGQTDYLEARTIVDLGAHIGLATLRLLAGNPGAHVVAVEADPVLVQRLRANVSGLPVTVVHAAVAAEVGERAFFRADRSSWANSLTWAHPSQTAITVPSITLEALLESQQLRLVDILKIDVEGAEWEVLADGVPDSIHSIVGEFHAQDGREPRALMQSVAGAMNVQVVRDDDGLLVFSASRSDRRRRI